MYPTFNEGRIGLFSPLPYLTVPSKKLSSISMDALASYATPLEGRVSKGQTPDAKRVSALTGALQNTAVHDPPLFDTSKMAQLFREGTEISPGPSFIRPPCIRHRWVIRGWTHGSGGLHSPVRKSAPM
jgi:hypothetical protein